MTQSNTIKTNIINELIINQSKHGKLSFFNKENSYLHHQINKELLLLISDVMKESIASCVLIVGSM